MKKIASLIMAVLVFAVVLPYIPRLINDIVDVAVDEINDAAKRTSDEIINSVRDGFHSLFSKEKDEPTDDVRKDDSEASNDSSSQPSNEPSLQVQLGKGDSGEDVKKLQEQLQRMGYHQDSCDGIFGNKTQASVETFQSAVGLPVTGIADETTLEYMNGIHIDVIAEDFTWTPNDVYTIQYEHSVLPDSGYIAVGIVSKDTYKPGSLLKYCEEIGERPLNGKQGDFSFAIGSDGTARAFSIAGGAIQTVSRTPGLISISPDEIGEGSFLVVGQIIDSNGNTMAEESRAVQLRRQNGDALDEEFRKDNTTENFVLLKQSANMSKAVYNRDTCESLLKDMGYLQVESFDYDSGEDTVACMIGYKRIWDEENKSVPLIAVIVRGTTGTPEWVSNFNMGVYGRHYGFDCAARQTRDRIKEFLKSYNIADVSNAKLWITGHSRGAAVANLIAAHYAILELGFKNDKIYAYTFATPNPVLSTEAKPYGWIRNYIIGGDLVTNVPMKDMPGEEVGFGRFGITTEYKYHDGNEKMDRISDELNLNRSGETSQVIGKMGEIIISREHFQIVFRYVKDKITNGKENLTDREKFLALCGAFTYGTTALGPLTALEIEHRNVMLSLRIVYEDGNVVVQQEEHPEFFKWVDRIGITHDMDTYIRWINTIIE